jgi:hypothetical protein
VQLLVNDDKIYGMQRERERERENKKLEKINGSVFVCMYTI